MSVQERAACFPCAGEQLFGVFSEPAPTGLDQGSAAVGVVIVVGGPQYRVGSHRQFVQLARALAAQGHVVLRFDVRGMGDSSGAPRSFDTLDDDIRAAIDALRAHAPALSATVLWGLCDGASAALMYVARTRDARVSGLCLANPWLRSAQGLAKTHVKHYYRQRLMQPEFWKKLLSGGVAAKALSDLARNLRLSAAGGQGHQAAGAQDFRQLMALAWRSFNGPMLLLTSSDDYTAREFLEGVNSQPDWAGALAKAGVVHRSLAGADHTFSGKAARLSAEAAAAGWLGSVQARR